MNPMAMMAARLGRLERAEAENALLWSLVDDLAHVYEIADIQDLIERARTMQEEHDA